MARSHKQSWQAYRDGVSSGDLPDLASLGLPGLRRRRGFAPTAEATGSDVNKILDNLLYIWSEKQDNAQMEGGDMDDETDDDKGKEERIFELCMEFLDTVRKGNLDRFKELLDSGIPVNFQHPRTKETALHIAAGNTGWSWVKALGEHKDTDYLIRDRQGKLAWNNADFFALDEETAAYLLEKTKAQAARDGVDLFAEHKGWLRKWFNEPWFQRMSESNDFTP